MIIIITIKSTSNNTNPYENSLDLTWNDIASSLRSVWLHVLILTYGKISFDCEPQKKPGSRGKKVIFREAGIG